MLLTRRATPPSCGRNRSGSRPLLIRLRSKACLLTGGAECRSQLIDIPTGLGKTAAVVMAWLWNSVGQRLKDERRKAFQT